MSTDANASTNLRRSYWEMVTQSSPTRRMMGRMVVVVLFVLPVIAIFATDMLLDVMKHLNDVKAEDAQAVTQIVQELRSVGFLFLSVIIMLCMLCFYFVFFLAVRIYGPQIALIRFIDQLKNGNYERFRNLRRDDQLKETWQALQELADSLREKYGSKTKG